MNVWWCAEHEAPGDDILTPASPCFGVQRWSAPHREKPCRLVEMRLVPVDALVLVRAGGNWPIPVIAALSAARVRGMRRDTTPSKAYSDALDALAEAAKESPQ